jgi:hypothetical protein
VTNKLTRSEQIVAEKTVCVLLVRGESPDGKKIFAYVAIRADKLEAFMEAQKKGTFYPEDYGIVVESGEGEPNETVKQKMTKEYGFNHEAMLDLDDTSKAHSLTQNLAAYSASVPKEEEE